MRRIPYPPSLSIIPARNIEPAIGASTWAFGSHKCKEYRGSFTKKARIVNIHQILIILVVFVGGCQFRIIIDRWEFVCSNKARLIKRGSEADTVYMIM